MSVNEALNFDAYKNYSVRQFGEHFFSKLKLSSILFNL